MTINLSDNTPRVSYTVAEGVNQTSFTVTFEFFAEADLNVYVDGILKTLTTDYSVSGGDGSTGSVTISVTGASGGSTVVITRDIALERTTDFPAQGAFQINSLNTELDKITAQFADRKDAVDRSLRLQDSDAAGSMELPLKADRAGTVLGFNATTGVPEVGPTIADVSSLSAVTADIATLADIEDGTDATDAIQTVASISSNVSTVAGVSANVTTVAGQTTNMQNITDNLSDVQNAATNAITATTKASEAATSATNAATSESNSASSASSAATSASDSETSAIASAASESAASTSESNASTSETNAASSASSASTSAATATTQAGIATTKAGEASTSASNAATSEANAETAKTAAETAKTAAETAQTAAETAETNAETAETAAAASETAAASSASSASTSAATATTQAGISTTKASEASTSASNAATSEANSATSETNASTSASNAASSASSASSAQTAAESARDATLAAYDNFDDRYLGSKSSAPTVDNDGNALVAGALYFDTVAEAMYVYTGSAWVAAYVSGTGFLALTGGSMTGDINFGDNDKAIFGAGSDLQIYHDPSAPGGASNYIKENGGLYTYIDANTLRLRNRDGTKLYANFVSGAASSLYYDNNSKLATTSGGIDVTGTVTADGLTVDGNATIQNTGTPTLTLSDSDGTNQYLRFRHNGNESYIDSRNNTGHGNLYLGRTDGTSNLPAMKISSGGDVSLYADDGTTQGFFWDASTQRLGLGTTSPSQKLSVVESGGSARMELLSSTSGTSIIDMGDTSDADIGGIRYENTNNAMLFRTNNDERLRITSGGNVGIGTSSPSTALDVTGTVTADGLTVDGGGSFTQAGGGLKVLNNGTAGYNANIFFGLPNQTDGWSLGQGITANDGVFRLYDNGAGNVKMSVTAGGDISFYDSTGVSQGLFYQASTQRLGLGVTNPGNKLSIANNNYIAWKNNAGSSETIAIRANTSDGLEFLTGSTRMTITSDGIVLVGKTSTSLGTVGVAIRGGSVNGLVQATRSGGECIELNRTSSDGAIAVFTRQAVQVGNISVTGSGTTYNTTSDIRLKTDIAPISDATDKLMAMNAVTHKWKADPDADAVVGFIAQEMAEIVPEAVSKGDSEDDMWSMDYGRITPVLVAALQDANKKIAQLEQRIADMENN